VANPLLSRLRFGSYLVYSPRGTSDVSRRSQRIRDRIKAGDPNLLQEIAKRLASEFATSGLAAVLGPSVALVPAPRSSPLLPGALWPPRLVAEALATVGLGRSVVPLLERVEPVPKSAFARPGERPNARKHYDTMRVSAQPELVADGRLTIVDDFLTKGNTLLGGASRLAEVYPGVEISVFGLVRTKGLQLDIERVIEPCLGEITRIGEDEGDRSP
jgi:hypothetical protein